MRQAETVLGVVRERGRRGLPLERLYRMLFNPQLYLLAYQRLYSNTGAMTAGVTGETVDGMSLDAGFKDDVAIHGALHGIDVQQVKRSDQQTGFVPVKRRWVVEQTHGTLMLHRRLVRDYESKVESSVSRTFWASTANLVRRLTGTSTPSWRHT